MKTEKIYRVTDIYTKNVLENMTTREVARVLGVSKGTIRSAIKNDTLVRCRYDIEDMGEVEIDKDTYIPNRMWDEWDDIRKPINKALKDSGKIIFISCNSL